MGALLSLFILALPLRVLAQATYIHTTVSQQTSPASSYTQPVPKQVDMPLMPVDLYTRAPAARQLAASIARTTGLALPHLSKEITASTLSGDSKAANAATNPAAANATKNDAYTLLRLAEQRLTIFSQHILDASAATQVDPLLLAAVIMVESGGKADAISPRGAQGLMQLMPATQQEFALADPLVPAANIMAGAQYLRQLLLSFSDEREALAAYNAGPGAVKHYQGIPPFKETQDFVHKVTTLYLALYDATTDNYSNQAAHDASHDALDTSNDVSNDVSNNALGASSQVSHQAIEASHEVSHGVSHNAIDASHQVYHQVISATPAPDAHLTRPTAPRASTTTMPPASADTTPAAIALSQTTALHKNTTPSREPNHAASSASAESLAPSAPLSPRPIRKLRPPQP